MENTPNTSAWERYFETICEFLFPCWMGNTSSVEQVETERVVEKKLNVGIQGPAQSGITSLLLRISDECFVEGYVSSIGSDYKIKSIIIQNNVVRMHIWDTENKDRFRTVAHTTYKHKDAIILTFDLASPEDPIPMLKRNLQHIDRFYSENTRIYIVGCKSDFAQKEIFLLLR